MDPSGAERLSDPDRRLRESRPTPAVQEPVMPLFGCRIAAVSLLIGSFSAPVFAQDAELAEYFGFDGLEVIKIGRFAGPITVGDVNDDGLTDLIAVNNRTSRIEVHYQKRNASPGDDVRTPTRVNEFPEHWRFRRENIPVAHAVSAVVPHDFDGDGLTDLIYAGQPAELVFLRQSPRGVFEVSRRHRTKGLSATRDGLVVADLLGDERPELLALVDATITIWPLDGDSLGQSTELAAAENVVAIIVEDFNGDGRLDVVGLIPEDPAPVRLWLGAEENGLGVLGAQSRFEMPAIYDCDAIRLPGEPAARMAVIERASKRLVIYELALEEVEETGDRDAALRIHAFTDAGNRERDHAVVDIDGDGRLDLIATDTEANAVVVYRQAAGRGLQAGEMYPSLSDLNYLVAGDVDDDPEAEVFVLSEKEGVVGRSDARGSTVPFPRPLSVSSGYSPTALNLIQLEDGPRIAVVAKDNRDYVIDLIDMAGNSEAVELGKLSRSPSTIVALDADQNGRTDLLLFTRDKPMTMLYAGEEGFELTESKDMGQFGLVKAATAENTAIFDIDGDGADELLIADKNIVRAVRYEPDPPAGVSPGWQVVNQINARDSSSELVSLALLGDRIVAADKENERFVLMARADDGTWSETESLTVRGFSVDAIHAGRFSGDDEWNLLAVGDEGFAVIRLAGERIALREVASWRTSVERRVQHEIASGDVNGDGFTDLITLDAGEQMCEIFTFTETGQMLYAASFQVFESKLFTGGSGREFEPSQAIVADVTGDGAEDLILLAHDRILMYPQMTKPEE
jgi:hypothetical protein